METGDLVARALEMVQERVGAEYTLREGLFECFGCLESYFWRFGVENCSMICELVLHYRQKVARKLRGS